MIKRPPLFLGWTAANVRWAQRIDDDFQRAVGVELDSLRFLRRAVAQSGPGAYFAQTLYVDSRNLLAMVNFSTSPSLTRCAGLTLVRFAERVLVRSLWWPGYAS